MHGKTGTGNQVSQNWAYLYLDRHRCIYVNEKVRIQKSWLTYLDYAYSIHRWVSDILLHLPIQNDLRHDRT